MSQRGIGQQVTQRTTQQGRPQIRILATGCQVVNAGQDDRVQDDDLAQKDDLLFGTHGTEEMPKTDVVVALRVSTVFCCVLYDVDGGGLCCRLVCHRSNEVTTSARLVFIVDEVLGINPAVELGVVAVPFHQSLRSSAHLAMLQYRFLTEHFIGGYQHLVQLARHPSRGTYFADP